MSFAISSALRPICFIALLTALIPGLASADMRGDLLRQYAIKAGLVAPEKMTPPVSEQKASIGKILFEDTSLSFNGDTSCSTCHVDTLSSADGLPNAIGVGGKGTGLERLASQGAIVPRNTLPLWGRGSIGFDVLFWDGKVSAISGTIVSQFGANAPSTDPLAVAAHLPFVEFREMIAEDDKAIEQFQREDPAAASAIYDLLIKRVVSRPDLVRQFSEAFGIDDGQIEFRHVAESVSAFIRDRFRIRRTRLHEFVFEDGALEPDEIAGGLIFYGKGRCAVCHNGPMFTDYGFHTVPFPQVGFGKNGFGVDYGRYNVTFDPSDLYRFRTPPLFNVDLTAPYGHSGSVPDLVSAIQLHFDPLKNFSGESVQARERSEYANLLAAWSRNLVAVPSLDEQEVHALAAFLQTLRIAD